MSSQEPSMRTDGPAPAQSAGFRSRTTSAIDLQERERLRVGFDLHDGPAQTMSAALLQLRMLEGAEGEELQSGLDEVRATLSLAIEEVYGLIQSLGDGGSADHDLVSRVRCGVEGFTERFGIPVTLTVDGEPAKVSPSLEIAIYRIIQEALSNVGRHSGARTATVTLNISPEMFTCEIVDDGDGFSAEDADRSSSGRAPFGLRSMSERARLLDGECTIESALGRGTRVAVRIPVWQG